VALPNSDLSQFKTIIANPEKLMIDYCKPDFKITEIFIVILFAISLFLFLRLGHHDLIGGADEGSYIAMGKIISKGSYFTFKDLDAYALANDASLSVAQMLPLPFQPAKNEQVKTGWSKGYPLISVPFWWIDNEEGWKYVNPLAAALSFILFFLILRRFCPPFYSFVSAILFATCWLNLWHARYPMTEALSQTLFLACLLAWMKFEESNKPYYLFLTSFIACYAIFTHFMSAVIVVGFFFVSVIYFVISRDCMLASRQLQRKFMLLFALLVVAPAFIGGLIWFSDPGIQRYSVEISESAGGGLIASTKTSAASSPGFNEKIPFVINRAVERYSNLKLFVHPVIIFSGILALILLSIFYRVTFFWALCLIVFLAINFILISRGIGGPHSIYVARRNVPNVIPIIYASFSVGLFFIIYHVATFLDKKIKPSFAKAVFLAAYLLLAFFSIQQINGYLPFANLLKGKDMTSMSFDVSNKISKEKSAVFLTGPSTLISSGMKYVHSVPVINNFKDPASGIKIMSVLKQKGYNIYILDNGFYLKSLAALKIETLLLGSYKMEWCDPNAVGPFSFPTTKCGEWTYELYQVRL
jgi:hypothetical protein